MISTALSQKIELGINTRFIYWTSMNQIRLLEITS